MSGLLFLGVVALWIYILKWLVNKIGHHLPDRQWRPLGKVLIFTLLLPLPLIDEVVGGWQFKRLCEANVVRVDKEIARGRTVYEAGGASEPISGTWIRISKTPFRFLDVASGELVLSADQLHAKGGHLFPGFDSGHDPLTFKGECNLFGATDDFFKELGLIRVDRPKPASENALKELGLIHTR